MNKYIDAEKLIKEINDRLALYLGTAYSVKDTNKVDGLNEALEIVESLRQEQQERPKDSKGKFVFPKCLYARTVDNKTIDVSYVPQSMDAIEYIRNNSAEEQQEVDLEKEYTEFVESDPVYSKLVNGIVGKSIARHFAEWGAIHLNARKEE